MPFRDCFDTPDAAAAMMALSFDCRLRCYVTPAHDATAMLRRHAIRAILRLISICRATTHAAAASDDDFSLMLDATRIRYAARHA